MYWFSLGGVLGLQYMGKHIGNPLRNMPGFGLDFGLFWHFSGDPPGPVLAIWEAPRGGSGARFDRSGGIPEARIPQK